MNRRLSRSVRPPRTPAVAACLASLVLSVALLAAASGRAAQTFDWPRWRGPELNGHSRETGWTTQWPKEGPPILWRAEVGIGFSSITVAGGRAFTLGNRNDKDTVYCFDGATGREIWKFTYDEETDPHYYEGGTSGTPTLDGDAVYTLSRRGELFRFEAATGRIVWRINLARATGAKVPEWGFASAPLVEGDRLILNAGSAGTAIDKRDGKVVWTSDKGSAGYSSAVPFVFEGERHVVMAALESVIAVRVKDGARLWEYPWKTRYDVNAADPILAGDKVFISSAYDHGGALLRVRGREVTRVWENKNLRNHINTSVLVDGHLYGIDGDAGAKDSSLRCVVLDTGEVKWTEKAVGSGALMVADGKLIVLSATGELIVAEPSPEAFQPIARAQVIGGKCWTVPVLARGRIYCRNAQGRVVCVDVRDPRRATTSAN